MIIAVDFDGTCVESCYPRIGEELPDCVRILKLLVRHGHKLILWTMRSGKYLAQAEAWFETRGIKLWAVNENPEQYDWTDSNKAYAHLYIDDAALGCPLSSDGFVCWSAVENWLMLHNLLPVGDQSYDLPVGDGK